MLILDIHYHKPTPFPWQEGGLVYFFSINSNRLPKGSRSSKRSKPGMGIEFQKGGAVFRQTAMPGFQVLHLVSQVGLGSIAVHPVFRSDVDLQIPETELETAPAFQTVELGDLSEPHHSP